MALNIDIQIKHSLSMLVCGGRIVDKTPFIKYMFQHKNELISSTPEVIVWCYAKRQPQLIETLLQIDRIHPI